MAQRQECKRYTATERKAYYMGVGAAIGFGKVSAIKKAAGKMSALEKKSFYNGFDDRFMSNSRGKTRGK